MLMKWVAPSNHLGVPVQLKFVLIAGKFEQRSQKVVETED